MQRSPSGTWARRTTLGVVAALTLGLVTLPPQEAGRATQPSEVASAGQSQQAGAEDRRVRRRNVVVIQADDFSMDLLPYLKHLQKARRTAAVFRHSFVVDSLCCSSRASTFTGRYPHNTGVLSNTASPAPGLPPEGGWAAWIHHGNERDNYGVRLHDLATTAYRTAFHGKFLNRYKVDVGTPVTPGWDLWRPQGSRAYAGWNYPAASAQRGGEITRLSCFGLYRGRLGADKECVFARSGARRKDANYATHATEAFGETFIAKQRRKQRRRPRTARPFLLHLSPYATHGRLKDYGIPRDVMFPPALRDRGSRGHPDGNCGTAPCGSVTASAKTLPGWNDDIDDNRAVRLDGSPAERWQLNRSVVRVRSRLTKNLRNRVRMAQSVDRLVRTVLRTADLRTTYVIFTADNGFHLGQHRMLGGKGTAYAHDVEVPLWVWGPGVQPGGRRHVASNVDLVPTVEAMAGLKPRRIRDGTSLLPALQNPRRRTKLKYAVIEHNRPRNVEDDNADNGGDDQVTVPAYRAVRSRNKLLVRYSLGGAGDRHYGYEFYRGLARSGSFEKRNVFSSARANGDPELANMLRVLNVSATCRARSCRALRLATATG